jgi:Type IV secretion system pilin
MLKKIKTRLLQITALALLTTFGFTGAVVAQDPQNAICTGADNLQISNEATEQCGEVAAGSEDSVNELITNIVNIFSVIVGIIAVIMIIWGGLKYITSGGDSGNVTGAKNTILYAIIGLIIVALAQIIVRFVLGQATNTAS